MPEHRHKLPSPHGKIEVLDDTRQRRFRIAVVPEANVLKFNDIVHALSSFDSIIPGTQARARLPLLRRAAPSGRQRPEGRFHRTKPLRQSAD